MRVDATNQFPLVSVTITTYNRRRLLEQCLMSVVQQNYGSLEVVVVDDFSSDDTPKFMAEFSFKYPFVKYVRHESNKGNAFSRNSALQACSGEYIAFMDDDDIWIDQDKLKKQVSLFNKLDSSVGIVCTSVRLMKGDGRSVEKKISLPEKQKAFILSGNGLIYSPTVMTKKSVIGKVGVFDTSLKKGVDSEFYRRCIVKYNYKAVCLEDITTEVREYGADRMTPAKTRARIKEAISANCTILRKYFKHYLLTPKALYLRIKKIILLTLNYVVLKND